jgi:hypothetical protein
VAHIFISHSTKDKEYVRKLEAELRKRGFSVWVDDQAIRAGQHWMTELEQAVNDCAALIVIMTPNSADEYSWVHNEIGVARERAKPIFPLLLDGEKFFSLASLQYTDVTKGQLPPERFYKTLEEVAPPGPAAKQATSDTPSPQPTHTPRPATSTSTATQLPISTPTVAPTQTNTPLPKPTLEIEYPRDDAGRSKGLGYLVIAESSFYGAVLLLMNENRPPLHDIRVRKAIDYSLPYAQTHAVVSDGVHSPIQDYNLSPVQEYDTQLDAIEAAKTFLAEAGYPEGFRINVLTDNSLTYYGQVALALEDGFIQANIEARAEIVSPPELDERIESGDYDIGIILASRLNP